METDSERGYQFSGEDVLRDLSYDFLADSRKEIDLKIADLVKDYEEKTLVDNALRRNLDGD